MSIESDADLAGMFDTTDFAVPATWISKDGGPGVSLSVIPMRPEEPFDLGASRGKGTVSACIIPRYALSAPPVRGDLIAFLDQGFVMESVEADSVAGTFTARLRRQ